MIQPKIKIFGKVYNVIQIEYDKNTGLIKKIIYQINERQNKIIFRKSEMISKELTTNFSIHEPTLHPYHDYIYAPDLESLLIKT